MRSRERKQVFRAAARPSRVAAVLAVAACFSSAPALAGDVFEAEAAGFHLKLEGVLIAGTEEDTVVGTVTIWPVANPGAKWTLKNARFILSKGVAATGPDANAAVVASGPGAKSGVVALGSGATGGAVAVGDGAKGGGVAVGAGAKGGGVALGSGATGGVVAVGDGAKSGGVAVGTGAKGGIIAVGPGAVGAAVTVRTGFKGTGDFEVVVGPRLLVLRGADLESVPGAAPVAIVLKAGVAALGSCTQTAGAGSRLSPGHLALAGSLRCGSWTIGSSTLTLDASGFSGGGTFTAWSKSFAMSYAASGDGLVARGSISGADTPWTRVPGFEAEYRIERPKLDLKLEGPSLSPTFGAGRVNVRTVAKKKDGSPWSSASLSPDVMVVPAPPADAIPVPFPVLPAPADVEKAARDACEAGARRTLAGQALQHALDVCRSGHPSPPSVPSLPRTISLKVGDVLR